MKKIFILAVMTIFLTSCSYFTTSNDGQKISPPSTGDSPIYGQWTVTKSLNAHAASDDHKTFLNKSFIINNRYFVLDGHYWDGINFKTKLVTAGDYFNTIGALLPKLISSKNQEIEVFSLSFRSKVLCDITILSQNKGILDISGAIYEISKTSTSPVNIDTNKLKPASSSQLNEKINANSKSGILLGLKTPGKTDDDKTSYRTLWISKSGDTFNDIYEAEDILFPRKTGFWTLKTDTLTNNNVLENIFIPSDLSQKSKYITSTNNIDNLITEQSVKNYSNGYIKKELTYVCNDFVSVNITGNAVKNGKTDSINKLHIYPVSSLPFEKSMSIDDIFKGTSAEITRKEFSSAFDSIAGDNVAIKNSEEQNKNIAIVRRDSHWLFAGKINYTEGNEFKTKDYPISVLPPSNIVVYDNLFAPFEDIKKDLPFAKDAFSSPNNDILIIISDEHLYVYNITMEPYSSMEINKTPLAKIKLKKGETVIMSEWSTGENVKTWNDFVKSLENIKVIK